MKSIAFDEENGVHISARIREFFKRYQLCDILRRSNAYKQQGVSAMTFLSCLFCLVFRSRSMFLDMSSSKTPVFRKDTIFERNGPKKAELLAKVYDHARHRFTRGFRMLTLGWSDGVTFLPVTSCLLSTENQRDRITEEKVLDPRSNGAKARELSVKKGDRGDL